MSCCSPRYVIVAQVERVPFAAHCELKGTKISIRRLIRSNVRRCAASSHHGRKGVGVRSSVPRFLQAALRMPYAVALLNLLPAFHGWEQGQALMTVPVDAPVPERSPDGSYGTVCYVPTSDLRHHRQTFRLRG